MASISSFAPNSSSQIPTTSETFTCITCHMVFKDGNSQRVHYKTEFHRFNLKRTVARLAPVTESVYEAKQKAIKEAEMLKESTSNVISECTACQYGNKMGKKFKTDSQLQQHLATKKHKEAVKAGPSSKKIPSSSTQSSSTNESETNSEISQSSGSIQDPNSTNTETESHDNVSKHLSGREQYLASQLTEEQLMTMTDDQIFEHRMKTCRKLELEECLFCTYKSSTLKSNLRHMSLEHGFYIPDIDYLKDLEGLIKYLGEKIAIGWLCLYCNGKGKTFHSMEACQNHMKSLSHCKILYEGEDQEEEFEEFYDFTEWYEAHGVDPEVGVEDLKTNQMGELILSNHATAGRGDLQHYYKQQRAAAYKRDNSLIQSIVAEYRAQENRQDLSGKLPPCRESVRNRKMQVRMAAQVNKLVRLRFRSSCPK